MLYVFNVLNVFYLEGGVMKPSGLHAAHLVVHAHVLTFSTLNCNYLPLYNVIHIYSILHPSRWVGGGGSGESATRETILFPPCLDIAAGLPFFHSSHRIIFFIIILIPPPLPTGMLPPPADRCHIWLAYLSHPPPPPPPSSETLMT